MKKFIYKIKENINIAKNTYKMVLLGDTSDIGKPGQFINIKLQNKYLRRPISICDYDKTSITILYKVVGEGTKIMSKLSTGEELDVLVGLGNGFDVSYAGSKPLLIGGGIGIAPLYNLAKELVESCEVINIILGYNSKDEVYYEEEFLNLSSKINLHIVTVDGSYGKKGFVTDAFADIDLYSYFYTCGPMAMFRAINDIADTDGQLSFEERMGCGFGACMGCSCKTITGNKRICKEGPVLFRGEIIWEN
ncbi:MAG: dihydroorotate dehydrogenase electron transfer subunit [Eubacteriales bacterium]|nr:dihydroorotate dehydrogenase electron transfer subunit [Eubacteriales bacterium]MDY3332969.1 dihydroorotate dehydrogenase electron transfer subunit [Gallibacter sp.]